MPFLQERRKSQIILAALIVFNLVLVSFQVPLSGERNYFERVIFSLFSPVQHGFVFLYYKIGNIWKSYFFLIKVESQNRKLQDAIFYLQHENNLLKLALQKLKDEKHIEEFVASFHDSFLITQVIGVDASNAYKSITIARGTLDGVERDMVILDGKGNLVGRIIPPISLKEAKVQLITDNESGVGVVSQVSRVKGVLTGDGKGNCYLKYIYATQNVDEGEGLETSGLDRIYPAGIKVGEVISLTSEAPLFQKIKVKPCFDFRDLDMVVIIKDDIARKFLESK